VVDADAEVGEDPGAPGTGAEYLGGKGIGEGMSDSNLTGELGPVYDVPLIRSLPLTDGGMTQAMPSRRDLNRAYEMSQRTAAGYEVLLAHYHDLTERLALAIETRNAATSTIMEIGKRHSDEARQLRARIAELEAERTPQPLHAAWPNDETIREFRQITGVD